MFGLVHRPVDRTTSPKVSKASPKPPPEKKPSPDFWVICWKLEASKAEPAFRKKRRGVILGEGKNDLPELVTRRQKRQGGVDVPQPKLRGRGRYRPGGRALKRRWRGVGTSGKDVTVRDRVGTNVLPTGTL